ncbi:hypothetical protein DCC81_10890 [Chitinophaga parva]|uniref:Uncharacterized protein n=1 Tax=Chitinophaga parva TaxID=2169414 RepID=A0A2T7BEX7_9BACT|nr:hypothetical protein [Chitinophaga parva]PUZ24828.1 hypothetical protein DCC81_10890 [Chitinophaga parva]
MSLEHLQFDPYFLARIYQHQAIIPGEKPAAPAIGATAPATPKVTEAPAAALPPVKFLGDNQKKIVLLISNANEVYLNDALFHLLTNILNACKLGMQDVALVNLHAYPGATFTALQQAVPMQYCIFFGVDPATLALQGVERYQVSQAGHTSLLYSHDLAVIAEDKVMKGRLWNSLKQLLGI